MKKVKLFFLIIFMCCFLPKIYAFDIMRDSVGERGKYSGIIAANSGGEDEFEFEYEYDSNWNDDQKISRITIDFNIPAGFSISVTDNWISDNDTLTGSGSNYVLTTGDYGNIINFNGEIEFKLKMPTITDSTKYNVSAVIKAYNSNNAIIKSKQISFQYNVLVDSNTNNCDNNSQISSVQIDGKSYTPSDASNLETTNPSVDFSIIFQSSKTSLDSCINSKNEKESIINNNSTSLSLDYGENMFICSITTECYKINQKSTEMYEEADDYSSDFSYSAMAATPAILAITRIDNRSKVNTLKTLTISNVTISFKSDLKTYMASVPYNVSSVTINSTLTDSKSSYVNGYGNRTVNLNEGNNDILIKVRAENGAETTYTVKINRDKNDDATLKKLLVNDTEISLKNDLLVYNTFVQNEVTTAVIKAEANDKNAKVEIESIKELEEGNNNVNITVTASNGKKNVYSLTIIRDKKISENSKLKSLSIKNHQLNFNPDEFNYEVEISNKEDKLELEALTDHPKAKVSIIGNKNLKNNSEIRIKVTAEDEKTVSTYIIKITKKNSFNILFIIIPVLIIAAVVGYILLNKKKNNSNTSVTNNFEDKDDSILNIDENNLSVINDNNFNSSNMNN